MSKLKILFVCTGNICRSPLAEGIFIEYIKDKNLSHLFEVDSCGTASYHLGSLPDERSITTAKKHSIKLTHKARQISSEDLNYYDFILVMDHINYEDVLSKADDSTRNKVFLLRSFDPGASVEYNVPDPYYGTETDFEEVFEICKPSIKGFLSYLTTLKLI